MAFEDIIEFAKKDNNILAIYKTGSGAFFDTGSKDIDLMIITKDSLDKRRIPGYDCFTYSYSDFLNVLELNIENIVHYNFWHKYVKQLSLFSIMQPNSLVYGNPLLPKDYNIFKYKKQIIKFILDFGETNYFNEHLCCMRNNERYCTKWTYYPLYAYYIFQNNSLKLTQEQHTNLMLAHACKIPVRYLAEIKEKLQDMLFSGR